MITRSIENDAPCVVAGGGPAGLEAARILAERGFSVVLMEATEQLGGQFRLASLATWRRDTIGLIDWRISELEKLGVDVRTNCYADVETVCSLSPRLVIDATGGAPDMDWLEGREYATSVEDFLTGNAPRADRVLVYDGTGRHPALTVADVCATRGNLAGLVLLDPQPGAELAYGERVIWRRELAKSGVTPLIDLRLTAIESRAGQLAAHFAHELTDASIEVEADLVVVEHGTVPHGDLFRSLRPLSNNDGVTDISALLGGNRQPTISSEGFELHRIGDAQSSRDVAAAMFDALRLCAVAGGSSVH